MLFGDLCGKKDKKRKKEKKVGNKMSARNDSKEIKKKLVFRMKKKRIKEFVKTEQNNKTEDREKIISIKGDIRMYTAG